MIFSYPILKNAIPVGGIFVSAVSTNPRVLLGYGTWEIVGNGKYIRCSSTPEIEGGSNSVTLTSSNIPELISSGEDHSHICSEYTHEHIYLEGTGSGGGNYVQTRPSLTGNSRRTSADTHFHFIHGGEHTHKVGSYYPSAITITPEFISLCFWKRIL